MGLIFAKLWSLFGSQGWRRGLTRLRGGGGGRRTAAEGERAEPASLRGLRAAAGGWGPALVAGLILRARPGKVGLFFVHLLEHWFCRASCSESLYFSGSGGPLRSSVLAAPNTSFISGSPSCGVLRVLIAVSAAASQTCFFSAL